MAFFSTAIKGALLLGLVMTGLVDKEASASSSANSTNMVSAQTLSTTAAGPFEGEFHGSDQELRSNATSPAAIELLIEAANFSYHLPIYFMNGSIELTPEAELTLLEVADEISASEDPAVHFYSFDEDNILAEQRIDVISEALSDAGFAMARTFITPQIDLILARDL